MATDAIPANSTPEDEHAEFIRKLMTGGFEDVLVLDLDAATRVLTEKRRELLERIDEGDVESVRSLATDLGRDKASVSRDLDLLFEHDIIEYERDGPRKIPESKHETVLVKPIL